MEASVLPGSWTGGDRSKVGGDGDLRKKKRMEEEEEEESFKFSGWQKRQEAKKSRGFHHVSECVCVCEV